jgi:hypothetical protein
MYIKLKILIMKHLKRFESYSEKQEVKVNEEFDFAAVSDIYNNFVQWLQQSHYDGTHDLVYNWETVSGVLGALGLVGGAFLPSYLKFSKEKKDAVNKRIADTIAANPDKDPKEIAKEITEELK